MRPRGKKKNDHSPVIDLIKALSGTSLSTLWLMPFYGCCGIIFTIYTWNPIFCSQRLSGRRRPSLSRGEITWYLMRKTGMKFLFPENVVFITHFPFILWLEKGCTAFGGFSSADWYASVNVLSTLRNFPQNCKTNSNRFKLKFCAVSPFPKIQSFLKNTSKFKFKLELSTTGS